MTVFPYTLWGAAYLCVTVVHGKVGHDDWNWQCYGEHPAQGAQGAHEHAQVGFWRHVPVTHCSHGHKRPPEAQGDWVEVVVRVRLDSLRVVDEWGEDDDSKHKEEDEQHELFSWSPERLDENFKPRGVSGQLEQPQDPDDGKELEDIGLLELRGHLLKHQVDVEAHRGYVVDDVHARVR